MSSGAPQVSILGLLLFNILVTWTAGLSAPSAHFLLTPHCVVQLAHWREGMPARGIWTGMRWAYVNFMRFEAKCKVLTPGNNKQYSLCKEWFESSSAEKDVESVSG